MQVHLKLIGKDGSTAGEYDRDFANSIPSLVTTGGRVYLMKRITSGKDNATYYESDIYDLNGL